MLFPITYRSGRLVQRQIMHPSWSFSRVTQNIQNTQKTETENATIFAHTSLISLCFIFEIAKHHQNRWQTFTVCFVMRLLWTIPCYSNFQMAGVIVNSPTHVLISPSCIPQTSNSNVRCDCTALIWNIHLTCEVLCCHLPRVNSMASIIEGPGRGRLEAPVLCPVWWPKATWSVSAEITSWEK